MQFLLFLMIRQKSIIIIMSCLEAVTISGFKNFSPHSYQTLEFTGPLTLITGKGGSGKSVKTLFTQTILQVLNYVLTSSLRNQRDKCHPTDPRLIDQLLMKAQARLKFRTSSGKTFIACRVVNTMPFRKMTLKQAVLGFKHQGKQHDIDYNDSKGKQMDEAIFHLLNTNRSFLDFVVFSHQAQQPYFFNNLALNFFDVFGIRQFGELINSLEEQQNYFQIQSGKLKKSTIQAKKLYDHDVEMKKSSLAVLQKISDRYMQLENKIEQSTQIETSCDQTNDEDAVQIVEIKKKANRKRQGANIRPQMKKQNSKALQGFTQKVQMDLAANIAFQQYNRPMETKYLYLKMHSSIQQLASQDLKATIQTLYDSLNQILSKKMMEINQIMNEIWAQLYEGNDIVQIKMSLSDTSPQYRKDRVSFSIIKISSQNEYCMLTYCSLSQSVLASIAIRLALILVLSPDHKLLIMDSPTNHLSADQTRRLAQYLCKLIQAEKIQVIIASNDSYFNSLLTEKVSSTYEMSLSNSLFNVATKKEEIT